MYALAGVLIGGRTFFVIADIVTKHDAALYFGNMPGSLINVIAVWNGGMGFFGGLIGVIVAVALFIRKHPGLTFSVLADELVVMLPIGLALTRIVNFINDELWGNICRPDHPYCIVFPSAPAVLSNMGTLVNAHGRPIARAAHDRDRHRPHRRRRAPKPPHGRGPRTSLCRKRLTSTRNSTWARESAPGGTGGLCRPDF